MEGSRDVVARIEQIKSIFLRGRDMATSSKELSSVLEALKKEDPEFRPVSYEGAAMEFALKDFSDNDKLNRWNSFLERNEIHLVGHTHIGLGWAIGRQEIPVWAVLEKIDPFMRSRVLDGLGYYDGAFRQRKTIRNKKIPDGMNENNVYAYDQGVGRSVWYSYQGQVEGVAEIIAGFSSERQKNLWRGIGIACTFVGGSNQKVLKAIVQHANLYRDQVAIGASLVSKTLCQLGYVSADLELACRVFCNISAKELAALVLQTESGIQKSEDAYRILIGELEKRL